MEEKKHSETAKYSKSHHVKYPPKHKHIHPSKMSPAEYDKYSPWIWIDIESSGLDSSRSEILEIYVVVTDSNMEPRDHLHLVIHHPMHILLAKSSLWCKRHFGSITYGGNGLFDECQFSNLSYADAEHQLWDFFEFYSSHPVGTLRPGAGKRLFFDKTLGANGDNIQKHDLSHMPYNSNNPHRLIMLAGSTVHFDRDFVLKYFPSIKRFLNHKVIDVTSLLETARRFRPEALARLPKPNSRHRAREDIFDSIGLFKYIKDNVFSIQ